MQCNLYHVSCCFEQMHKQMHIRPRCGFSLLNLIEEKLENYKSYRIYSSLERKENKDGRSLNLFRAISIQCK